MTHLQLAFVLALHLHWQPAGQQGFWSDNSTAPRGLKLVHACHSIWLQLPTLWRLVSAAGWCAAP